MIKIKKHDLVLVIYSSFALTMLNISVGATWMVAVLLAFMLFSSGITYLMLGKTTALGIIYALFSFKSFWLAALLKPLFLESFDEGLYTPIITMSVYSLGLIGILLASILLSFYKPIKGLLPIDDMPIRFIRLYSIIFCLLGLLCWILLRSSSSGNDVLVGGLWGVIKTFFPLGVVGLALFAYVQDTKSYKSKNDLMLFVFFVASYFIIGVIGAGKQQMMVPLVIGFFVALRIYGFRSLRIWFSAISGIFIFIMLIYPYAQYSRTTDLRSLDLTDAIDMAIELSYQTINDPSSIATLKDTDSALDLTDYAPEAVHSLGRLMFIGDADYLISQTYYKQDYTGFQTITHGFEFLMPHFLYPDKPQHGTGAFLGQYAGQLGDTDYTTQVAYGFFANLYNAFGLFWVLPTTFILTLIVFGCVIFYWGRSDSISPSVIIVFMMMQHSFVEGSVSSQIQVIRQPVNFAIIFILLWLFAAIKNGRIKF